MKRLPVSLTLSLLFVHVAPALSQADLNMASRPLELGSNPMANVLFVTDDSGSMDWEIVVQGQQESLFWPRGYGKQVASWSNGYMVAQLYGRYTPYDSTSGGSDTDNYHAADNRSGLVAPTQEALDGDDDFDGHDYGVWRLRNHHFNTIYYNPEVRYLPWTNYPNVNPSAAPADPSDVEPQTLVANAEVDNPTGYKWLNLTADYTYRSWYFPRPAEDDEWDGDVRTKHLDSTVYIPHFYIWTDSDSDGIVDYNDGYSKVEIKPDNAPFSRGESRSDCADNDACTYAEELQNFANWFSYYRRREFVAKAAMSLIVADVDSVRLGYASMANLRRDGRAAATTSATSPRVRVSELNSNPMVGARKELLDKIYITAAGAAGGTPLRRALDQSGRYFACTAGDIFGSSSNSSPGDADCPYLGADEGGTCQQSFTILFSDGLWTDSSGVDSIGDDDCSNSIFAGGAFCGPGANTLGDIAMHYYRQDLQSGLANNVPPTSLDRTRIANTNSLPDSFHQHMGLYTVGFGVDGSVTEMPSDPSQSFSWGNPMEGSGPVRVDDLRHAAYNGRGQYYSATNPEVLRENISSIIDTIKKGAGASTAVSFNTQEVEEDTRVFRAFFNTTTNTGDLVAQTLNDDGTISSTNVWSAAKELDKKIATSGCVSSTDSRVILSYSREDNAGIPFQYSELDAVQKAALTEQQVSWLRGHRHTESPCDSQLRDRNATEGLLGDIVSSQPLYVGPPRQPGRGSPPYPTRVVIDEVAPINTRYETFAARHKNRRGAVVVGSNDGMLHVFEAETGEERFAYLPRKISDTSESETKRVSELTELDYEHQFFVDLTPVANDVFIEPPEGGARDWKTVLIGGLRAGGRGYFAIDITDDDGFQNEAEASSHVMWEFTDQDDSDLGLTFSPPLISMSNIDYAANNPEETKKWVAIFGNGYNSGDGYAKLFVAVIEGGQDGTWTENTDYFAINTGAGPDGLGKKNGLGIPRVVDIDGNGTADYAYAGDLQGNLWRFDLTSTSSEAAYSATKLFTATDGDGKAQPITTRPVVVRHPEDADHLIVVFATGSWMTTADGTNKDIQSLYGVRDSFPNGNNTAFNRGDLQEQTLVNIIDAEHGAVRIIEKTEIDWGNNRDEGWFIDFDVPPAGMPNADPQHPGEKAIRNLQVRGGYLFVGTVFPLNVAGCGDPPGGTMLALDPTIGGLGDEPVFDLNDDNFFNVSDTVTVDGEAIPPASILFDKVPADSTFIGNDIYTQLSDRSVTSIGTNTARAIRAGRLGWRQLEDAGL